MFYPKSNARYIRLRGLERVTLWGNQYGHSLYEVQAFGKLASTLATETLNPGKLDIYPNPASEELFISGLPQGEKMKIEIFDILGQRILKKRITGNESIDLPSKMDSTQIYLVHLHGKNFTEIRKMAVK